MVLAALVVIALTSDISPASAQPAPGGSFRAESEGLPVATEMGSWAVTDSEAVLTFGGGQTISGPTTFVAVWTTPVMPGDMSLSGSGAIMALIPDADRPIVLRQGLRYRTGAGKWSPWGSSTTRVNQQTNLEFLSEDFIMFGSPPEHIQFQWRLNGIIADPATLDGEIALSVE